MAKKEKEGAEESETKKSIGAQMKSKLTQRERNLKVKREMIEKGEREEPENPTARTQHERNLINKGQPKKEDEKGKSKSSK